MNVPSKIRRPAEKTEPPPPSDAGPYTLTICVPNRDPWTLVLEEGKTYVFGRHPDSEVFLDFPWVSERHAQIQSGDPPILSDLGSRNGTYVDGRLLEPGQARPLNAGMLLHVGKVSVLVSRMDELTSVVQRRARALSQNPSVPVTEAKRSKAPASGGLVLRDARMAELYSLAERVAAGRISVLVTGETGVGKELLARAIHRGSARSARSLVTLNCAAIPESLIESELFGYERGAFSGATSAKAGLFEAADGSTLFLDEIGELPILAQSKLLRVLETGEVLRLGAVRPQSVDVRIVAATNRNLLDCVAAGSFRADLFYRLNGITLEVPPLRERRADIAELAEHFARGAGSCAEPLFSEAALEALLAYSWPGNVRELKAVIERAHLLAKGNTIQADVLLFGSESGASPLSLAPASRAPASVPRESFTPSELPTGVVMAELERRDRRRIEEALEATGGNQKAAAELLGISRRTLMNRLDRYHMVRPRKRRDDEA